MEETVDTIHDFFCVTLGKIPRCHFTVNKPIFFTFTQMQNDENPEQMWSLCVRRRARPFPWCQSQTLLARPSRTEASAGRLPTPKIRALKKVRQV